MTGEWRKLHNEELHNLYSSPDIIRQIKWRRMRWAGHVARMGEKRKCIRFWWESPKERDHLEDQGVGGKMGSEWILGRLAWVCGLDSTGSVQGPVAGCCGCGDEPSGSCATELVSFVHTMQDVILQTHLLALRHTNIQKIGQHFNTCGHLLNLLFMAKLSKTRVTQKQNQGMPLPPTPSPSTKLGPSRLQRWYDKQWFL
jgi:hypothetical protein